MMSDLIIVHRTYQLKDAQVNASPLPEFLLWQTCRREIYLADATLVLSTENFSEDEVYYGLDAEEFLIEVLCGLKSPLVGETEVFGQFKNWWKHLPECNLKNKFSPRIQQIYSAVKNIREESLCGLGSQSYGSLLRKQLSESNCQDIMIDFIGAGQLVEEIVPWIQKKWNYRIWCRDTQKVLSTIYGASALEVVALDSVQKLSPFVVVAAPLKHEELNKWVAPRKPETSISLYDFRHDSVNFKPELKLHSYLHLDHFSMAVQDNKTDIQKNIALAYKQIKTWKQTEQSRVQVRPFGWDDL